MPVFFPREVFRALLYNLCVFFPDEPVPVEVVRELSALLAANGLSELTLESKAEENPLRLSLERETRVYISAPESGATESALLEASEGEVTTSETATPSLGNKLHEIGAPCVGVYRAPKQPLQIGDKVRSGQVVAVVESLRVPNEVVAHLDGTVQELPVVEGQGVEWGQTLLVLESAS